MNKSLRRNTFVSIVKYSALLFWATITISPIAWTLLTSVKHPDDAFAYPPVLVSKGGPVIDNFYSVLFPEKAAADPRITRPPIQINIVRNLINSIVISVATTVVTLICSALGAYAFSRFSFRGKSFVGTTLLLSRMLPPVALIVPLYMFGSSIGLLDTRILLIFSYCAFHLPLSVLMLKNFFDVVPKELEEAAMIEGCSRIRALAVVIMPLVVPGLAAVSVLTFLFSWKEFTLALALTGRNAATMPLVAVQYVTEIGVYWGPIAAITILILLPGILFVVFAQKYIVQGLIMGASKG